MVTISLPAASIQIYTILVTAAPLAGLCSSSYDVSIEPPGLLHNHFTKHPDDVTITLSHTPAYPFGRWPVVDVGTPLLEPASS
jgi:hypothetical protein